MVIDVQKKTIYWIALIILIIDQLSKFIARKYFSFVENTGAAFGILEGKNLFLILISIAVALFVIYYLNDHHYLELGFLLGGITGNLIDRIFLGYVVDFIDFGFWPSFNIADSFNTVAVILLIWRFRKD